MEDVHDHPGKDLQSKNCCKDVEGKSADHKWGSCEGAAAPPPQETKSVNTVVRSPTNDTSSTGNDQGVVLEADDNDDPKAWDKTGLGNGAASDGVDVKAAAEDVTVKVTTQEGATGQPGRDDRAPKRRVRRRFKRRPVVVMRRSNVTDQKSSTEGQDGQRERWAPGASDGGALPDSQAPAFAPLPKDQVRQSGTGLKARALFIGLAGVVATALLLSAVSSRTGSSAGHPVASAPNNMAPSAESWAGVYQRIQERNAAEQQRCWQELENRPRSDSPVSWGLEGDSDGKEWVDVTRDVPPMMRGRGWAAAIGDELGAVSPSPHKPRQAGRPKKRGLEPYDPWSVTWTRSPESKRLRRVAGGCGDDDPWRDVIQPYWGGDWTRHQKVRWWTSEEQKNEMLGGPPSTPEVYRWSAQAQPAWGGTWA